MSQAVVPTPPTSRYATLLKLAQGGMASVWVGTVRGGLGFRQLVAIKKPHPHLVEHADFRAELLAEAQLASSIHHANVVDVRDVEVLGDDVSLVMDYIEGASLSELLTRLQSEGKRLDPAIAVRICVDALAGLHAAHELCDDRGRHVGLVHRDVSPQNILVGVDGHARVVDFGVAKFHKKDHSTTVGQLKGKIAYMAPEYLRNEPIDRGLDVFAMGVVLWESLTGVRLFRGSHDVDTMQRVLGQEAAPVSSLVPAARCLDAVLEAALAKDRQQRFGSAAAMAAALESSARSAGLSASPSDVGALVRTLFGPDLALRREKIREKMAHEPSVASLFEGAKGAPAPAPLSLSPATIRDPEGPRGLALGPDLGATLREDGPVELMEGTGPKSGGASRPIVVAEVVTHDSLSLSTLDRASIPRPRGALFWSVALGVPALAVVIACVVFVASRRGPAAVPDAAPSAAAAKIVVSAAPAPSAPPATATVSASVASVSGPLPVSAPKHVPVVKPSADKTGKPGSPPPNPYAH